MYGSVSPYFKNVEPINVTLSPSNGGNIKVITSLTNNIFSSRSYLSLINISIIVDFLLVRTFFSYDIYVFSLLSSFGSSCSLSPILCSEL